MPRFALWLTTVALCALALSCTEKTESPVTAEPPVTATDTNTLCVDGTDTLCSTMPQDITKPTIGYSSFGHNQNIFDDFSWQMFVALNWPANSDGTPSGSAIGSDPDAKRVWQHYPTADEVMGVKNDAVAGCVADAHANGKRVIQYASKAGQVKQAIGADHEDVSGFLEATGQPLIDVDLNFVLYDVVVNPVEADYILDNNLNTIAGQKAFQGAASFPMGHYDDPETFSGGSVGAIEIKTAWRILLDAADHDRFFTMDAHVVIDAKYTVDQQTLCFDATLGLVGFHAMQRTESPPPQDWMWATFEHVDNAPLATNAQDQADTSITISTCDPPADDGTAWSFYNKDCSDCPTNVAPALSKGESNYLWASEPPYAINYATGGKYGTQVVRCWKIYEETQEVNAMFRKALAGTVWENYHLISTQWKLQPDHPTDPINAPTFLSNTTMETYIQTSNIGSCLSCHQEATMANGESANLSFVLGLAQ